MIAQSIAGRAYSSMKVPPKDPPTLNGYWMPTLSGHRTAVRLAVTAAALAAVALTVGASPVSAAPATPTVEFSGGSVLGLLICKSEPNTADVSVPADSRVNFVNRLGQNALLKVDGQTVATVKPNEQVPVAFKKGPAEVLMTFDCGIGLVKQFKSVSVGVTAVQATPPAGGQVPTSPARSTPGATRTTPPSGPTGAAASASNNALNGRPGPSDRASKTPQGQAGQAGQDVGPGVTGTTDTFGTGSIDPTLLDPSAAPALAVGAGPSGSVDDRIMVGEPVAASGPARGGLVGLLALVATVCVVGVGIAAIRAIIAQRASRASFA
ncbi:hypothetical protein [Dactylosporangium sp. NPDC051484]|uniref:hypothetical protein n=1 Tax=Dactylosporangium sp. NPDC051484 TaxID=3154942 RepID=UPI00344CC38A